MISESTTGRDVTDEYVDTDARVRNADATHSQVCRVILNVYSYMYGSYWSS